MADDVENDDQWLYGESSDIANGENHNLRENVATNLENEEQSEETHQVGVNSMKS